MATEAELIEQKREERKKILDEIKRKRAAAARSEGIIGAAEEGQYGDVGQDGPKGEFDDEIDQDPGNEDPSRFSMANLKRAILGEGGGLESLMYFLPGTGDVMSAQDSVRAAKAAQEAENIVDKIKLYGLSGLAAAGALPLVSAIYDAGGPAVKRMIDQAIKQAENMGPQPALAGTPGVMNIDDTIDMGVLQMAGKPRESGTVKIGKRDVPVEQTFINESGKRQILPEFNLTTTTKKEKIMHAGKLVDRDMLELVVTPSGARYYKLKDEAKKIGGTDFGAAITKYFDNNPDAKTAVLDRAYTVKGYPEKITKDLNELTGRNVSWKTYLDEIKKIYKRADKAPKTGLELAESFFQSKFPSYIKNKYNTKLSLEEQKRYFEEFRIAIQDKKLKPGQTYTPQEIQSAINLVEDTVFKNKPGLFVSKKDKFADLDLDPYVDMRKQNQIKTKENFEKGLDRGDAVITMGHYGKSSADRILGEGADTSMIVEQTIRQNTKQKQLDESIQKFADEGDTKKLNQKIQEMKKEGLRSYYYNKDGDRIFVGADPEPGKLKDGGMVGISHLIRPL
jgi:hypothetical protein